MGRFSIKRRTLLRIATSLAVLLVCWGGTWLFVRHVEQFYPMRNWLIWTLLQLAAWTLFLNGSFVVLGYAALRRIVEVEKLPPPEILLLSMTLGLSAFGVSMLAGGALGWFHGWFALGLPISFCLLGIRDVRRLLHQLPRWGDPSKAPRSAPSIWSRGMVHLARGFGAVMIALLYLESLSPDGFNFDAIWYHVPIAQDYAREGALIPFYGDNHRAYPQLTSLLHTWALLVPGIEPLPVRWMLMLQIEFSFVMWRLLGAAAAAQWLLNGRWVPGLWALFFLFPSVFIYDQNIAGSADHVLGATAVPIFLATGRLLKRFDLRWAALCGIAAGCHVLTRYQAIYLVVAVGGTVALRLLFVLGRQLWNRVRRLKSGSPLPVRRLALAPLMVLGCALLVSSPQFIKNWVFYDNPLYPFGSSIFPSEFERYERPAAKISPLQAEGQSRNERTPSREAPSTKAEGKSKPVVEPKASSKPATKPKASSKPKENSKANSKPKANSKQASKPEPEEQRWNFRFPSRAYDFSPKGKGFVERTVWLHKTLLDWSFETGNRHLTRRYPYMGSLFTLLLPLVLFLHPARRLWFSVAFCYLAFATWGLTNANDRYLLAFLSVPIGTSGALLVRAWHLGRLARLGLLPLVAVQLFWTMDAPLHYGDRALRDTIKLLERGYGHPQDPKDRFEYRERLQDLTKEFPPDAIILGRYFKDLVGFDRTTLNTHRAIQEYIPLNRIRSTRELWWAAKERGVTHLLYPEGQRKPHWLQDIVLIDALAEASPNKKRVRGFMIAELGEQPPKDTGTLQVLVLGDRQYVDGLYPVHRLSVSDRSGRRHARSPKDKDEYSRESAVDLLKRADAVVMKGARLDNEAKKTLDKEFKRVERFGSLHIYVRKDRD